MNLSLFPVFFSQAPLELIVSIYQQRMFRMLITEGGAFSGSKDDLLKVEKLLLHPEMRFSLMQAAYALYLLRSSPVVTDMCSLQWDGVGF